MKKKSEIWLFFHHSCIFDPFNRVTRDAIQGKDKFRGIKIILIEWNWGESSESRGSQKKGTIFLSFENPIGSSMTIWCDWRIMGFDSQEWWFRNW